MTVSSQGQARHKMGKPVDAGTTGASPRRCSDVGSQKSWPRADAYAPEFVPAACVRAFLQTARLHP